MKKVQLITDGACLGNPGPGGWAAILRFGAHRKEIFGCEKHTTNNRMELQAAIQGLRILKERCEVEVVTDSEYVMNGVTSWMAIVPMLDLRDGVAVLDRNADQFADHVEREPERKILDQIERALIAGRVEQGACPLPDERLERRYPAGRRSRRTRAAT